MCVVCIRFTRQIVNKNAMLFTTPTVKIPGNKYLIMWSFRNPDSLSAIHALAASRLLRLTCSWQIDIVIREIQSQQSVIYWTETGACTYWVTPILSNTEKHFWREKWKLAETQQHPVPLKWFDNINAALRKSVVKTFSEQ